MNSYLVSYEMHIDADSATEAAQQAYAIVSEHGYWDIPPSFSVTDLSQGDPQPVDLVPPNSPLGRLLASM